MTLAATVVGDLHRDTGALADLDPESDVGFFAMSPAGAEQVTQQIRSVLDRGWEYIALAYKGRAFTALGYPTWDAYVDARFGDFRIAVPREHRAEAVAALAGVRMSVRAIAKLLGVGVGTVHREMAQLSGVPNGTPDGGEDAVDPTLGRDGKSYPRRRTSSEPCGSCGDRHEGARDCPWDLFAQGVVALPDQMGGGDSAGSMVHPRVPDPPAGDDADAHLTDEERDACRALRQIVAELVQLPGLLGDLERALLQSNPNTRVAHSDLTVLLDQLSQVLGSSTTATRRLVRLAGLNPRSRDRTGSPTVI